MVFDLRKSLFRAIWKRTWISNRKTNKEYICVMSLSISYFIFSYAMCIPKAYIRWHPLLAYSQSRESFEDLERIRLEMFCEMWRLLLTYNVKDKVQIHIFDHVVWYRNCWNLLTKNLHFGSFQSILSPHQQSFNKKWILKKEKLNQIWLWFMIKSILINFFSEKTLLRLLSQTQVLWPQFSVQWKNSSYFISQKPHVWNSWKFSK